MTAGGRRGVAKAGGARRRDLDARHGWAAAHIVVVLVFVVSRVVYRSAYGIRFDSSPAEHFMQYLPPWFVEHDFWRSVLYLHHQVPLQILIVQGSIKLFGLAHASVLLEGLYVALGLLLSLALLRILLWLGAPATLAAIAVCLFQARPTAILYETWLFYPLPTAFLLVCSLLALLRYYRFGTPGAVALFFWVLAGVALIRSTFSWLFLAATGVLLLLRPAIGPSGGVSRSAILKAAAVPLLLVFLNTAKTSWLMGHSFGEAFVWQSLCEKIYLQLPAGERHRLVAKGLVTPVADYRGLTKDAKSYGRYRVDHAPTGVPLLDLDSLPDGASNSHALEHVLVSERYYRRDALYLLGHYGADYWQSVWSGLSTQYLSSAALADGVVYGTNFKRLEGLSAAVDRLTGVQKTGRSLALVVALPLAWLYGLRRLVGARASSESERTSGVAIAFMLLAIAYSTTLSLLVSYGDFNRYRYDVDGFYVVLLVLLVADAARFVQRSARGRFGRTAELARSRVTV